MREYAALQGRSGQRAGSPSKQGDSEGRLQDLNLDPSDESKSVSPERPPAGGGRTVRRDDFGGSMRVQPHSAFRESALGDTRRSVDIPSLLLPTSAQVPQSSLRDDLFSSARYSFTGAESAASAKSGKSRGLWSRFKSGIGRPLAESRRATPSNLTSLRRMYELIMQGSRAGRAGAIRPMRSSLKISETRRRVISATAPSRMRQPICAV